uniref:Metallo-beta-lactamase domain-containing protein n=1 Tax=Romanomermis culicivorax TaxID=13658 RepID=A0A915L949_ROMCU
MYVLYVDFCTSKLLLLLATLFLAQLACHYQLLFFLRPACRLSSHYPVYNLRQSQYLSCDAWSPRCPTGSTCQMADDDWKRRLDAEKSPPLYLCCSPVIIAHGKGDAASATVVQLFYDSERNALLPVPLPLKWAKAPPETPATGNEVSWRDDATNKNHSVEPADDSELDPRDSNSKTVTVQVYPLPKALFPEQKFNPVPGNGLPPPAYPHIVPLVSGFLGPTRTDGTFKMFGSSTLIQDAGYNIVVDTSCSDNKNILIGALAQQGIKPQHVHIVIYTHFHPAFSSNDNLFPYAQKIYSNFIYKNQDWISMKQLEEPRVRVTDNVEFWQTNGRSYVHNSVIVRNVGEKGSVVISVVLGVTYARNNDTYNFLQGLSGTFVGGYTHVNEEEIFVVDLGGFCNGSYNCRASYTECKDDTCTCLDGFVPTKDLTCQTTRLYCPNLESNVPQPLEPRNVRPCYKFSGQNDTTPCSATSNSSQEFCFLYPLTKTGQNAQVGHCCPKPQIGSKISYGVCPIHPSFHPDMACEGCYEFGEQCVAFRHWSSANSYSFNSQCCPFPCQTTMTYDMISVDGICYLNKYVSESCLLDVQCKTAKSYCASSARSK